MNLNLLVTVFDGGGAAAICDFIFSFIAISVLNVFIDYFVIFIDKFFKSIIRTKNFIDS